MTRRVLVTGATGHLGPWVMGALARAGWAVVGLARRPLGGIAHSDLVGPPPVAWISCDLATDEAVPALRRAARGIDAVVHLAAFVPGDAVQPSTAIALATLAANVRGTIRLLRALQDASGLAVLVNASCVEVYGTPRSVPIYEGHPTEPLGYYGASKLAAEHYVRLFGEGSGIPTASLRLPAVYGPGDRCRGFLGNLVRAAAAGDELTIEGDGSDRCDLVYAADAAAAILAAVERSASGTYNVGSGRGTTAREMVEAVVRAAGGGCRVVQRDRTRTRHDHALSCERAKRELGWVPTTTLEEGVKAQLAWVRSGA